MDNVTVALTAALVYWLVYCIDSFFSWQTLVRPIIVGPITGLVLGDLYTGCVIGAYIEALYVGIISAGGGSPADGESATIICTSFVIAGGLSTEAAVAIAIPIGTIMSTVTRLVVPVHAVFIQVFEKYAREGNGKAYCRLQQVYRWIISETISTIVVFFAVLAGSDAVTQAFAMLPAFIIDGLGIAGNIMPALGLGILLSMTFKAKFLPWLFIGFALSAYAGLGTMAIAVFAACAAVIVFIQDAELHERFAQQAIASPNPDSEEEFFA